MVSPNSPAPPSANLEEMEQTLSPPLAQDPHELKVAVDEEEEEEEAEVVGV